MMIRCFAAISGISYFVVSASMCFASVFVTNSFAVSAATLNDFLKQLIRSFSPDLLRLIALHRFAEPVNSQLQHSFIQMSCFETLGGNSKFAASAEDLHRLALPRFAESANSQFQHRFIKMSFFATLRGNSKFTVSAWTYTDILLRSGLRNQLVRSINKKL